MTVTMLYHWAKYGIRAGQRSVDTGNNIDF